ncbi:MAG: ComEC/Rec2 family competence protein [Bacteroidales bacterium]|jgi:competence protein ComEC
MGLPFRFRQVPLLRVLIPYTAGILCAMGFHPFRLEMIIISFVFIAATLLLRIFFTGKDCFGLYPGMVFFAGFFLCGLLGCSLATRHHEFPDRELSVTAIVHDTPEEKPGFVQMDCRVLNYTYSGRKKIVHEMIRVYFSKPDTLNIPSIGDSVCFTSTLQRIKNRGNPKEFDFGKYMRSKGIYYQTRAYHEDMEFGGNSGRYRLRRLAARLQKKMIGCFIAYSIKDDELAVLSALAAGNREYLGDEIKNRYAGAGAMHVLAVSGLHVGILYLFLSMILFRNRQTSFFKGLRFCVILLSIWLFAFITGLSSPVVRASLMFSFFLAGKSFNRTTNSYNILAASALIVLVNDPLELCRVGFQFSYLAVLGIVYIQPRLFALVKFNYALADRIWQLMTVSIAAQLSLLPLSLYYFHRFPVYFWLTNVLIIPLVWLIMVCTMVFFIVLAVGPLALAVSSALDFLLKSLNFIVESINLLPAAVVSGIRFEAIHLVSGYLLILAFLLPAAGVQRVYRLGIRGLVIILFLFSGTISYIRHEKKKELIVYNYNRTILSFIDGHDHLMLLGMKKGEESAGLIRWNRNFEISRQLPDDAERLYMEDLPENADILGNKIAIRLNGPMAGIDYSGTSISILENSKDPFRTGGSYSIGKADLLIFGRGRFRPEQFVFSEQLPEKIIFTRTLPDHYSKAWQNFAAKNNVGVHHVVTDGAFHLIMD